MRPHLLTALGTALVLLAPASAAQDSFSGVPALTIRPAAPLPSSSAAAWIEESLQQPDSLSDAQLALRLSRLYSRQAELLEAEAAGDIDRFETILDATMQDLRQLAIRPGVAERPRFRELYRSVLTEYERYYGPDPELALERGDVFALRAEMFAALDDVDEPLLEDVDLPSSVVATFPMTINRAVENQIRFYLRNSGHIRRVRERAATYFPMIEQVLAEEGVPDELKYLAVIESALNPVARSWAGAAGMWQFIPATGRHSGLTVTRELDERLDPEKATRAAARHLKELYEMFGDWQLAIAGYNMNPLRVQRYVAEASARLGRPASYWDVYDRLPRETRGYIPAYIAVALIMSNPDAFQLPDVQPGPRYEFDLIHVRGGTSLSTVAQRAGTDLRTLQALNPALRRAQVPDWAGTYAVRIPAGHYAQHASALQPLVQDRASEEAPRTVAYVGNNRRVIAFAHLPVEGRTGPQAPMVPVQEVADRHRQGRTVTQASSTSERSAPTSERIRYRVRRGDTLIKIARAHGVTVRQLRDWNGIRGSHIRIGQRLTIHKPASRRG